LHVAYFYSALYFPSAESFLSRLQVVYVVIFEATEYESNQTLLNF
jgi:hypothetical protein